MKAYLDIENSKTNQVITVEVPVVTYDLQKQVVFDIKNIGEQDFNLILNAINPSKEYAYTDIELFFIDGDNTPNFGPDYLATINGNYLILNYQKHNNIIKNVPNEDWTYNYETDFEEYAKLFLKNNSANYMIIFYDNGLKYEFREKEPTSTLFMDYFFDKGYKAIALFKKNNLNTIFKGNIRDNLIYVDSYCEIVCNNERRF